jgi:hypothetical protein
MFDVNAVYNKTEAGLAEVKSRSLGLNTELRRLLILVDGGSPLGRLATFVRGSEVGPLIFELETLGLIAATNTRAYRKTDAGVVEVQTRALGLRSELRRLLILVDGRAALSHLASFVPGQPILDMVEELETAGLIAAPSAAGEPVRAMVAPVANEEQATQFARSHVPGAGAYAASTPRTTDAQLQAVRDRAVRGLRRILGVQTHEWLDKLQQPGESHELRAVIADIQQILEEQFGVATGQQFLDSVRGAE